MAGPGIACHPSIAAHSTAAIAAGPLARRGIWLLVVTCRPSLPARAGSNCCGAAKSCRGRGQLGAEDVFRHNFDAKRGRPFLELSHSRFKPPLAKTLIRTWGGPCPNVVEAIVCAM